MAEQMKESGIQWIGAIPYNWNVERIKHIIQNNDNGIKVGPFGSALTNEVVSSDEGKYKVYGQSNLIRKDFSYGDNYVSEQNYKRLINYEVLPNDIAVSMMGTIGKCSVVPDNIEPGIMDSHLIKIRLSQKMLPRYFEYAYESDMGYNQLLINSKGSIMNGLNSTIVKGLYIPVPGIVEQQAIVDFLDKECAQIDSIATDLEKQIELLQQYKKSLITETVIKGLNKSVPMKDSGTDWIPYEIPEQWELSKIKYIFNLRDEKNYRPLEEVNLISLYTDLGVVQHCDLETTTGNKAYTADGYKKVYVDDIVVNIILCWMGAIGISQYEGVTSPAYDVYYAIDKEVVCPQYYHYLFKIEQFHGKCYSVGRGIMAMRWRTYSSEFRNITIPVPPIQEQREIAEFLDKKCSMIDQIILQKEKQLKSIQQHKKSLIYEYVTGKKRVKEVQ